MIQAIIVLNVIISSLITGAIGDGFNDKGKKLLGHVFKAIEIIILLMSPFVLDINQWLAYGISYIFIRGAIFDPIYNIARGNKLSYIGNSSLYGKILRKFKAPTYGYWWMRGVFLLTGIAIAIKEFYYA